MPQWQPQAVGLATALVSYALSLAIAYGPLQVASEEGYRSCIALYISGEAGLGFRCGEIYVAVNSESARVLAAAGGEGLLLDLAFIKAITDAVRTTAGPPRLVRLINWMLVRNYEATSRAGDAAVAAGDRDKLVRLGASCFIASAEVKDLVANADAVSAIATIAGSPAENAEAWTRVRRFA